MVEAPAHASMEVVHSNGGQRAQPLIDQPREDQKIGVCGHHSTESLNTTYSNAESPQVMTTQEKAAIVAVQRTPKPTSAPRSIPWTPCHTPRHCCRVQRTIQSCFSYTYFQPNSSGSCCCESLQILVRGNLSWNSFSCPLKMFVTTTRTCEQQQASFIVLVDSNRDGYRIFLRWGSAMGSMASETEYGASAPKEIILYDFRCKIAHLALLKDRLWGCFWNEFFKRAMT